MIHLKLTDNTGLREKAAGLKKVTNESLKKAVWYWRNKIMPGHFKRGAARKYNYDGRSVKYNRYKRKKGGMPALVFSGTAKRLLTRAGFYRVTGSAGQAKGRPIVGSQIRYFYMTTPGHPNKPKELTRTIPKEEKLLGKIVLENVVEGLKKIKGRKRVYR